MESINWLDFQDIMRRFQWYPDSFTLLIYCKDAEEMNLFIDEIEKWNIKWEHKQEVEKSCVFKKSPFQQIEIFIFNNNINYCGVRANAVLFNATFSFTTIMEHILPLANIHPSYGCFYYDRDGLKTMFNYRGRCAGPSEWNKYMLNLEEEKSK